MSHLMDVQSFVTYVETNCEQRFIVERQEPYYQVFDTKSERQELKGLLLSSGKEARLFAAIMNGSCRGAASRELLVALHHHSEEFCARYLTNAYAISANGVRARTKAALAKVEAAQGISV